MRNDFKSKYYYLTNDNYTYLETKPEIKTGKEKRRERRKIERKINKK